MGKVLQIRVSAWTFSEDEVEKTWPNLWKLIWDESGHAIPRKGVLELVRDTYDAVRVGLVDAKVAEALKEKSEEADKLYHAIEKALNDRDPKTADKLSYEIEDCLDALEDIAKKF